MKRPKRRWLATMRSYRWRWPGDSWVRDHSNTVTWTDGRDSVPKDRIVMRFVGLKPKEAE